MSKDYAVPFVSTIKNHSLSEEDVVKVDVLGRVGNASLSVRHGVIALFEAVINSIDSIEESGKDAGYIIIDVIREGLFSETEDREQAAITGFDVIDNGNGFNTENYTSFDTSDSTKKLQIGGKGVGRFFWLKVFEEIQIESIFIEDEETQKRSFDFVLRKVDPIQSHKLISVDPSEAIQTTVRLRKIRSDYATHIPTRVSSLAQRLLEHCLAYFVVGIMPKLSIKDGDEVYDINAMYQEFVKRNERTKLPIGDHNFEFQHFLLEARAGLNHQISYCAARRVVNPTKLTNRNIPHLPKRITSDDHEDSLVYMTYVLSPFLDEHVNLQRTGFNIYAEGELLYMGDIVWSDIEDAAINEAKEYLKDVTEPTKIETNRVVKDYVKAKAPQYRYLLHNHPDVIDRIPPDSSESAIDLELYKTNREKEIEIREVMDEILEAPDSALLDPEDEINKKYDKYLLEINELGKAALAEYIVRRRKTLALLERYMKINDENGYYRERAIHNLIFPMYKTSDEIPHDRQNLWIIDERLSFHHYFASDLRFREVEMVDSDSLDRADFLIFDLPIAVVEADPNIAVTIFEFKRPNKPYGNPVTQMYRYVRELRSTKAKGRDGRYIDLPDNTPFYCYAICDLTPDLKTEFSDAGMLKTPDGKGYFTYNQSSDIRAYVEVIGYDKLLNDATQRNRILFETLGING